MAAKIGMMNITIATSTSTANAAIMVGYVMADFTVRRRWSSFSSWIATRSSTSSRFPPVSPACTIDTNSRRDFRGNSNLNSNLTDLEITDSVVAYDDLPVIGRGEFGFYRKLSFELILDNLEGEAIVA